MPTKPDSETEWTAGLPNKSGWYFMRNEGEGVFAEGMIVWVGHNGSGVRHEGEFMYAAHPWLKRREFLGPVLHSDFEQLLRLRETALNALIWMDWWKDPTVSAYPDGLPPMSEIITALREALGEAK